MIFVVSVTFFTSGLALVVTVEYIGYIQRSRLAAWAADEFEHDFRPAVRNLFERSFPEKISIVHIDSVTTYKISDVFEPDCTAESLEIRLGTFSISRPVLIVAVPSFWIHIIVRLRFDL